MAIDFIRKGEVIRASFLNKLVEAVNETSSSAPRDLNGEGFPTIPETAGTTQDTQDDSAAADILALKIRVQALEIMLLGGTWTEVSRSTDTLRIEDPDDSDTYIDVIRITSVRLTHPLGGDMTLSFTNP